MSEDLELLLVGESDTQGALVAVRVKIWKDW